MYELFWRYEFSKITNRIGKKLFQSLRTYAVKWQFLAEIPSVPFKDRSDTEEQSGLFDSNYGLELPPTVSI
jgi:hypothetical protein